MIICLGLTPAIQRAMVFSNLRLNGVNRASQVIEAAAGKSVNVAKVLQALGEKPLAMGVVGGERGEFLRRELDRAGIVHDLVTVEPSTRLCVTVIDCGQPSHTELIEESQMVAPAALDAVLEILRQRLASASLLVLSGTLTPQAPPDFYARCVTLASQAGVRTIVDATGKPMETALAARPAVVKPNRAELAGTAGMPVDTDDALRSAMLRLIQMGAGSAVITLGAHGLLACDGRNFCRLDVPKVEVVNTIGSGDSLAAGLAAGLARGMDLFQACRLGAACGVANTLTLLAGQVNLDDVLRIERQIRLGD